MSDEISQPAQRVMLKAKIGNMVLKFNNYIPYNDFLQHLQVVDTKSNNDDELEKQIWTDTERRKTVHNDAFGDSGYSVITCESAYTTPNNLFSDFDVAYTKYFSFMGYTYTFGSTIPREFWMIILRRCARRWPMMMN